MKAIQYPCSLSPSGYCEHGGNKYYNYGFCRGLASYCRKRKRWIKDMDKCPLSKEQPNDKPTEAGE